LNDGQNKIPLTLKGATAMNLNLSTGLFLFIYLTTWIVGVVNGYVMKHYFVSRYPAIANQVFPDLLKKSISSDITRFRYILARGYTEVEDPAFVKRMDFHRLISLITVGLIMLGMIFGVFLILAK